MRLHSCELPHDRHGCRPYAEQLRIRVLDANADWKSRGEMEQGERRISIGQSGNHLSVLRKHSVSDALYPTGELFFGMPHEIHINSRTNMDVLHLALPVVRDYIPFPGIDQCKHGGPGASVGPLRDIHVGHKCVEGCDDTASF